MNSTIKLLVGILIAQAALFFALSSSEFSGKPFQAEEELLAFDLDGIDSIAIEAADNDSLELKKGEGQKWTLPSADNFPVSETKMKTLAAKLFSMKKGWPVATSSIAAKQFKVASDEFEKKIAFANAGQNKAVIYLGTSPGFKKIHLRKDGEDNIYSVNFASYDLPVRAEEWNDKDYLNVNPEEVSSITIPAGTLVKEEGKFVVESGNADTDESNSMALAITGLTFVEVMGTEEKEEFGLDKPVMTVTLKKSDDSTLEYTFGRPEEDGNFFLKRSDSPFYFKLMNTALQKVLEYKPEPAVEESPESEQEEKAQATDG